MLERQTQQAEQSILTLYRNKHTKVAEHAWRPQSNEAKSVRVHEWSALFQHMAPSAERTQSSHATSPFMVWHWGQKMQASSQQQGIIMKEGSQHTSVPSVHTIPHLPPPWALATRLRKSQRSLAPPPTSPIPLPLYSVPLPPFTKPPLPPAHHPP